MRWKKKQKGGRERPKIGERGITRRFLWFPKRLDDECRWLELTWIHQEYRPVRWMTDGVTSVATLYDWVDLHWATADEFVDAHLKNWRE